MRPAGPVSSVEAGRECKEGQRRTSAENKDVAGDLKQPAQDAFDAVQQQGSGSGSSNDDGTWTSQ